MNGFSRTARVLLAVAMTLAARAQAQEAPQAAALTLRDAAESALGSNPALTAAKARVDLAQAHLLGARSMWLPVVDATQSVTRSDNPVFVFGSLLEQGRFAPQHFDPSFLNDPDPMTNYRAALNVRYPLFDQLRRLGANEQARRAVEQAGAGADEARQGILLETISRYYGVVIAREKRNVAADAVKSAEADTAAMRDRFDQGILVEAELLAAEVQLSSFRQQLIAAEGDLAVARAALATVSRRASADVPEGATLPTRTFATSDLDAEIAAGLSQRGEIRGAAAGVQSAHTGVRSARGALLPRVDAFASWGASGSTLTDTDPDRTYGLVVGLSLFDGSRHARIAEARAALKGAHAEDEMTRDRIRMEIITAHHRARAAFEKLTVATRSVEHAEAAARMIHDRYDNGLTTITEQLRAQTALVGARLELLAARYEYVVGHAELMRATGGLTNVDPFL